MNKAAVANLLVRANAFAPFRFLNRSKLLVLMYHRFSEQEEFGKTSRRTFETQLRYLTRHYKVISLNEAVTRLRESTKLPQRAAVITIDDGYRDSYDIAFPVLTELGLPATIYLVTEFVAGNCWIWTDKARHILSKTAKERLAFQVGDKLLHLDFGRSGSRLALAASVNAELKKLPDLEKDGRILKLSELAEVPVPHKVTEGYESLSWDQAREMSRKRVEIGSHTATHPILTNVDSSRLEDEINRSRAVIEREIGSNSVHFCYPNGNVSGRERDAVQAAGYNSAVTTEIKLCENDEDLFLIPRIDAEPDIHRFVQATSGFDRIK